MLEKSFSEDQLITKDKDIPNEEGRTSVKNIIITEIHPDDEESDGDYYKLKDIKDTSASSIRKLFLVCIVCFIFMGVEVAGGIISGSIAILTDAAHLLSDLSGFMISIASLYIGRRPASKVLSFGYHRAEVIGALASVVLIWALTGILVYLAVYRVINPEDVDGKIMFITSCVGIVCNCVMGQMLHSHGHGHDHGHGHGHGHGHSHGHDHGHGHDHHHGHSHKKKKAKAVENKPTELEIGRTLNPEVKVVDQSNIKDEKANDNSHSHSHHSHSSDESSDENETDVNKTKKNQNEKNDEIKKAHSHEDHEHEHHDHEHKHDHEHHEHDNHDHKHDHDHEHDHKHDHGHDHEHDTDKETPLNIDSEKHDLIKIVNDKHHPLEKKDSHDHDHDHSHDHDHDHNHDHSHDHDHDKSKKNSSSKNKKNNTKNLSMIDDHDNPNVRAALIHIIGDFIQSIGVMIAAIIIWVKPEWHIADPICTFFFSILVLITTTNVVKDCIRVLMEGTPTGLNVREFEAKILAIDGVVEIHDLHVWSLSIGKPAMSAHLTSNKPSITLKKATKVCRKYGIYHSTLQIEHVKDKEDGSYINCDHNIHK